MISNQFTDTHLMIYMVFDFMYIQRKLDALHKCYSFKCIVCMEFHMSLKANGGDDRGLSDIQIALCVNIKLMFFL